MELDSTKVQEAMREEVAAMEKMGVWRRVDPQEMRHDTKVVPTKWVLVNKGDADHVEIRARLVACEVKGAAESEPTLFAATPPLDSLRCLISLAAPRRGEVLDFVCDVKTMDRTYEFSEFQNVKIKHGKQFPKL